MIFPRLSRNKKRGICLVLFGVALFVVSFLGGHHALAQSASTNDVFGVQPFASQTSLGGGDIRVTIAKIIRAFFGLLGVIVLGIMIYAGYLWMTSNGDEEKIETAKAMIRNAAIGLAIILSSLAIVQFILSRLAGATGFNIPLPDACRDPLYASAHVLECNPRGPTVDCNTFPSICAEDKFYVRGVTPVTQETGMNNISIRAFLSQPIDQSTQIGSILTVTLNGSDITNQLTHSFIEPDGRILEIVRADRQLFAPGTYHLVFKGTLTSTNGKTLQDLTVGSTHYPLDATWKIGTTGILDTTPPVVQPFTIAGLSRGTCAPSILHRGTVYPVEGNVTDDHGVGGVRLALGVVPNCTTTEIPSSLRLYDIPTIARGSDAPTSSPFHAVIPLFFAGNTPVPALYHTLFEAMDIDSNGSGNQSQNVVLVGESCDALGAPTVPELASQCLAAPGGECTADWQCISGVCDEANHVCLAYPIITGVDPWSGAEKNWVTISGIYFGSQTGEVEFGYDKNNNNIVDADEWIVAQTPTQCEGVDTWNDDWIIVEVPSDISFPQTKRAAIRVSRGDQPTFQDTTIDDRGPQPGENGFVGWFTKNTTNHPGLCGVQVAPGEPQAGAFAAPEETKVVARGQGFGDTFGSVLWGGSVPSSLTSWAATTVLTQVPKGMNAGKVSVTVRNAAGTSSNSVPFTVLPIGSSLLPLIESIDPPSTTPDSFVTIRGQRFGALTGEIWLASDEATAKACATHAQTGAGCTSLDPTIFPQCNSTWSNTQVIAYIPQTVTVGDKFIALRTASGFTTNGGDRLTIKNGGPRPSICSLVPTEGPAPLPIPSNGLTFGGKNFGATSTLYFWRRGAALADPLGTWLYSPAVGRAGSTIRDIRDTRIIANIPIGRPGLANISMDTGPIKIFSGGAWSNSVTYTVKDCRDGGQSPGSMYRCCTTGEDAGLWKHQDFACQGEVRDAGYVWRFTSGKNPVVPYVVESCDAAHWNDPSVALTFPSPVPWEGWKSGQNACINANIALQFSMEMTGALASEATSTGSVLNPDNVKLFKCTEAADGTRTCTQEVSVSSSLKYESRVLTIWQGSLTDASKNLLPNTWYRVELSNKITGHTRVTVAGVERDEYTPLKASRPCGTGTAYCYDFKTSASGEQCVLTRALMHPHPFTTNKLGLIQDVLDQTVFFYVSGVANQECIVLNVDGLGWQWGQEDITKVYSTIAPDPSHGYRDTRGTGFAVKNTYPTTSDITAKVHYTRSAGTGQQVASDITATSTITVNLGKPEVIDHWYDCTEVCVNASLGATFNREMNTSTYVSGFSIYKCGDGETCAPSQRVLQSGLIAVDSKLSDNETIRMNLLPTKFFATSTWYIVTLSSNIKAVGGYAGGVVLDGEGLTPFQWKFKTKADGTPCVINTVVVNPLSYITSLVGDKRMYQSSGHSAPDACSPDGQAVDPWRFDWHWLTSDATVATVSNLSSQSNLTPWCLSNCTPAGSDIERESTFVPFNYQTLPPLCGNGSIDPGEECDIKQPGTQVGVTCSYSCTLKGNPDRVTSTTMSASNKCGNGRIEPGAGEVCDFDGNNDGFATYRLKTGVNSYRETAGPAKYCTNTCLLTGSTSEVTSDLQAPVCGSGSVTPGESCDIADPNTSANCSDKCLATGTALAQSYCDSLSDTVRSTIAGCTTAVSVCGNGTIERGEVCEFGPGRDGTATNCNSKCLPVGNICGTSFAECDPAAPGCSASCVWLGSSLYGASVSQCGDGVTSPGEFQSSLYSCEVAATTVPAGAPLQVVTAVGTSRVVDALTQSMHAAITARVTGYVSTSTIRSLGTQTRQGSGDYYLQCGFEEFSTPIVQGATTLYNNCADSTYGVGANSCCYPRSTRTAEYPVANAGITREPLGGVCRNTYIEATFNGTIDAASIGENGSIAEYHGVSGYNCTAEGKTDVTEKGAGVIAFVDDGNSLGENMTLWGRVWQRVKHFIQGIVGVPAVADAGPYTLCNANIDATIKVTTETVGASPVSKVHVYINQLLNANTRYVVLLQGGKDGIKNSDGVGISNPGHTVMRDGWMFQTGNQICKLSGVTVTPSSQRFSAPKQTKVFSAVGESTTHQWIVSIPAVYEWTWGWVPSVNPLFDIPVSGTPGNSNIVDIASKNVEGELSAFAQATVVTDIDTTQENHKGKVFSGKTDLSASFCEHIWPASSRVDDAWAPFVDQNYHFSFQYCADAGQAGTETDDLPYFSIIQRQVNLDQDSLREYLLFASVTTTDDAIGIKVLKNEEGLSLNDWYVKKFGSRGIMKSASVDGYQALTDGNNYYIGAYNEVTSTVRRSLYTNVYLFSVNVGAGEATRSVFGQVLDSLQFNTNIADNGYCLLPTGTLADRVPLISPDMTCTTDFDCRKADGNPKTGTSGICGNGRTKLLRDIDRLDGIASIQSALDQYRTDHGSYPALGAGTYYDTYTNTKWPSWQATLSHDVGGVFPADPINQWSSCSGSDTNQETCWAASAGQYHCPAFESVYEYSFDKTSKAYTLYGQFEYLTKSGSTLYSPSGQPVVNTFVDTTHFTEGRWCTPEQVVSPFGEKCGDGVVQTLKGEVCEIGQTKTTQCNINGGTNNGIAAQACATDCKSWVAAGACVAQYQCGNGLVETGETCDSGRLNGTYGHCNATCSGAFAAYCGNNTLDYTDRNSNGQLDRGEALEYCDDNAGGACVYIQDGVRVKPEVLIVLDRSRTMRYCPDGTYGASGWCANSKGGRPASKWALAKNALDTINTTLGADVNFKVTVLPGTNKDQCSADFSGLPPYLAIMSTLDPDATAPDALGRISTFVGTPTANTFTTISSNLSTYFSTNPASRKMVIYVTDGEVFDNLGSSICTGNTVQSTQDAITRLNILGVSTYVVGFGDLTETWATNLDTFATVGGTDNPNDPAHAFYSAQNTNDLTNAFKSIMSCTPYAQYPSGSCRNDCQAIGSYCGDRVVDSVYGETCDDGNHTSGDGCSDTCTSETAPQTPAPVIEPGICGNGVVNTGEACDNGPQNGVAPVASSIPYGESRTYCAQNCSAILTIDSAKYCGNGIRDWNDTNGNGVKDGTETFVEACDNLANGGVTTSTLGTAERTCVDKGAKSCTDGCQVFTNSCVQCGIFLGNPSVQESVSFLQDIVADTSGAVKASPRIALVNPLEGWISGQSGYFMDVDVRLNDTVPLFTQAGMRVMLRNAISVDPSPNGFEDEDLLPAETQLVTDPQCTSDYQITFNDSYLGRASVQDIITPSTLSAFFPYHVNGDVTTVRNEYVVSPAVPDGVYRIVARWTGAEKSQGVTFIVGTYSEGFIGNTRQGSSQPVTDAIVSYVSESLLRSSTNLPYVCSQTLWGATMQNYPLHWRPVSCAAARSVGAVEEYIHLSSDRLNPPLGSVSLRNTFIQAHTIYTAGATMNDPIAVFVEAMSPDTTGQPIGEFKNSELTLEVYEAHAGQNLQYSIYQPTKVFRIKDAAGTSSNSGARFWHVFNLVKNATTGKYEIQAPQEGTTVYPYGAIETDVCQLRSHIPGGSLCALL